MLLYGGGGWSPIILANCVFFTFFGGGRTLACQSCYIATSQRLFDQNLHSVDAAVIVTANPACVLTGWEENLQISISVPLPSPFALFTSTIHTDFLYSNEASAAKSFGRSTISLGQQFHLGAWNHSIGGFFNPPPPPFSTKEMSFSQPEVLFHERCVDKMPTGQNANRT